MHHKSERLLPELAKPNSPRYNAQLMKPSLPIEAHREELLSLLAKHGSLVLSAPPGTGKSTQVPQYVLDRAQFGGSIVVLQPRRVAARSLAHRVAWERKQEVGGEVGYQVRFESRRSESTRILYQTYGMFVQQLLREPTLPGIDCVLLDELHERSLEIDIALAWLTRLRAGLRPDLKLIVMSATLDGTALRDFLGRAPVCEAHSLIHPVSVTYQEAGPSERLEDQVLRAIKGLWREGFTGSVLVFLPGKGEIQRCLTRLEPDCRQRGQQLKALHGSQSAQEQQDALDSPGKSACVILSTNIAETSLTIPGVSAVIDSGLVRSPSYDATRKRNTLYVTSISLQNAVQRAGRAGRTEPGRCIRLWPETRQAAMQATLEPEIARLELSRALLSAHAILDAAGLSPKGREAWEWLTPPHAGRLEEAEQELRRLGVITPIEGHADQESYRYRLSDLGRAVARLPVVPLIGCLLLRCNSPDLLRCACAMAAIWDTPPRSGAESIDLLDSALDFMGNPQDRRWPRELRPAMEALYSIAQKLPNAAASEPPQEGSLRKRASLQWMRTLPKSIAMRQAQSRSYLFADGTAAALGNGAESRAGQDLPEALLAVEIHESAGGGKVRKTRIAHFLPLELAWIEEAFHSQLQWHSRLSWDERQSRVTGERVLTLDGLTVRRVRDADAGDKASAGELLAAKVLAGELDLFAENPEASMWVHRLRLVANAYPEHRLPKMDAEDWELFYHHLCEGRVSFEELRKVDLVAALRGYVGASTAAFVEDSTPTRLQLPSGRYGRVHYFPDAPPELSARLGDLLGMEGRFLLMDGKVEGLFDILAPNHRTVQKTQDISGFWRNTYPEVKKELKRRYPKHPWP